MSERKPPVEDNDVVMWALIGGFLALVGFGILLLIFNEIHLFEAMPQFIENNRKFFGSATSYELIIAVIAGFAAFVTLALLYLRTSSVDATAKTAADTAASQLRLEQEQRFKDAIELMASNREQIAIAGVHTTTRWANDYGGRFAFEAWEFVFRTAQTWCDIPFNEIKEQDWQAEDSLRYVPQNTPLVVQHCMNSLSEITSNVPELQRIVSLTDMYFSNIDLQPMMLNRSSLTQTFVLDTTFNGWELGMSVLDFMGGGQLVFNECKFAGTEIVIFALGINGRSDVEVHFENCTVFESDLPNARHTTFNGVKLALDAQGNGSFTLDVP